MKVRRTKDDLLREVEALRDHLTESKELSALRADRLRYEITANEKLRSDSFYLKVLAVVSVAINTLLVLILTF